MMMLINGRTSNRTIPFQVASGKALLCAMKTKRERFVTLVEEEPKKCVMKSSLKTVSQCRAKRSLSLPPNLHVVEKSSVNLFWFIPAHRRRRNGSRGVSEKNDGVSRTHRDGSGYAATGKKNRGIAEAVAAQWTSIAISSSDDSTYTETDADDERVDELYGIAFIDSMSLSEAAGEIPTPNIESC
jgi:hypothetical protein